MPKSADNQVRLHAERGPDREIKAFLDYVDTSRRKLEIDSQPRLAPEEFWQRGKNEILAQLGRRGDPQPAYRLTLVRLGNVRRLANLPDDTTERVFVGLACFGQSDVAGGAMKEPDLRVDPRDR